MTASATTIQIGTPRLSAGARAGVTRVSSEISLMGGSFPVWFDFAGADPEARAEGFLPALLLAAMSRGYRLASTAPVSPQLLGQVPAVQDILATWFPALGRVEVTAPAREPSRSPPTARGVRAAAFFSAGIDSWYTALRHRGELGALVFLHGFVAPGPGLAREATSQALHHAAESLGLALIEVETNLFELLGRWLPASRGGRLSGEHSDLEVAHGAVLASVAHLLPAVYGRVLVAASHTYNELFPWGSHPLLDPLWSTETRSIVHDGADASRVEKTRLVSRSEVALATLRVCPVAEDGRWRNCGRCEKCLRTMINLALAGALERCPRFEEPLDYRRVALLKADGLKPFLRENLAAARQGGADPRLLHALELAAHPLAPGRLLLEAELFAWKLVRRWLPLKFDGGRVRFRASPRPGRSPP